MGKLIHLIQSGREITVADLRSLSTREIHDDATLVLECKEVPAEVLSVLVFHSDPGIRWALCSHPAITSEILHILLTDDSERIRQCAASHLARRRPALVRSAHRVLTGWRFLKKSAFGVLKLSIAYFAISFAALIFVDTKTFMHAYQASNGEMKAYMACTMSLQILEPGQKDFSSCEAFRRIGENQSRKIATADFIEGECPAGYQLESGVHLPVCVKIAE